LNHKFKTIQDYQQEIQSEKIDIVEEIRSEFENIEEYNSRLNAFVTIFGESDAVGFSKIIPVSRKSRMFDSFPLFEVPLTIKDNIFLAGHRTTELPPSFRTLYQ